MKKNSDFFSALINSIAFILFTVLIPILIIELIEIDNISKLVVGCIYSFFNIVFWPIQISYHIFMLKGKNVNLLRRIDRSSVFFLISAIFTPILYQYTSDVFSLIILVLIWVFSLMGGFLILSIKKLSRNLAPIIGFIVGLLGIILVLIYFYNISFQNQIIFIIGALFLVIGGINYALKKPDIKPGVFGFHEIFHLNFFIGTLILHMMIFNALL